MNKFNYKIDKENMLDLVNNFPEMMETAFKHFHIKKFSRIDKIVICGMGGSAISGDLVKNLFIFPIFVNRGYDIPKFVDQSTLVILISYSGNTAEGISVFSQAIEKTSKIIVITSGGNLLKLAKAKKTPYYIVPAGIQPRAALPYLLTSVLMSFAHLKIAANIEPQIEHSIKFLQKEIPGLSSKAKDLSAKLKNRLPIILATQGIAEAAGLRFKNQLNENAKSIAIFEVLPESCHNFIEGLAAQDKNQCKPVCIILRDKNDNTRIKKTADIVSKMFKGKINIIEISSEGRSDLDRLLYLIVLLDYISVYLAILKGADPTSIDTITKFKKQMERKK